METHERFALLVPCYNAEPYIAGFINNIHQLDKQFDEVIFYDDASTDSTVEILTTGGFKVIKGTENKGPGFARNKLAAATKCNWFHFHDIDDEMDATYLTETSAIVQNNRLVDVVLCNVNWYDAGSGKQLFAWEYSHAAINAHPLAYVIAHPIGGINGMYRKSKFMDAGGFDTETKIWEDADMHVKLAAAGANFHVVERVLCRALRYAGSASENQLQGWLTRFKLLKSYQKLYVEKAVQHTIGEQAQVAAGNLILLGQNASAKEAFQLSETSGVKVAGSHSFIWRLLKWALPKSGRIQLRMFQLTKAFNK